MSAQDALGVVVRLGIAPPTQDQGRFQNVARVVGLAPIRGVEVLVAAVFHDPAQSVANAPQPVVVEGLDVCQQNGIRGEVRQLRQRRHHAGRGVGVPAESLGVVRPVRQEVLRDRLVFQHDGQLEGRAVAGRAEILH